jgi:hypothetical protein
VNLGSHRVRGRRQRCPLYGRSLLDAVVPQDDLSRVGAPQDEIRMEACELSREDGALTVKDVLGGGLFEFGVPNQDHPVRVVGGVLVVVVGGEE